MKFLCVKKFLILFGCFFSSSLVIAENLKCKESLDIFNEQIDKGIQFRKIGSVDDLVKYNEETEYAQLFKSKHAGQTYVVDGWVDNRQYKQQLYAEAAVMKKAGYNNLGHKLLEPKANFISSIGEVCIMPLQAEDQFFNHKMTGISDVIFVRDLKNDSWRSFNYLGIEKPQDFSEFFPDFPKGLRLSPALVNDQNFADINYEFSLLMFKHMGIPMNAEIQQQLQEEKEKYQRRLITNGHF